MDDELMDAKAVEVQMSKCNVVFGEDDDDPDAPTPATDDSESKPEATDAKPDKG